MRGQSFFYKIQRSNNGRLRRNFSPVRLGFYSYNLFFYFQVAQEIWVCENGACTKWKGDILKYKEHLKTKIVKDAAAAAKSNKK